MGTSGRSVISSMKASDYLLPENIEEGPEAEEQ